MLSRWITTGQVSGNPGLTQVQYAFLELPKLPKGKPEAGAARWAWLFVHGPELTEVPSDLPQVYQEALALANQATFTQLELDAYQKAKDEIQQVLVIADDKLAEGKAEGRAEGKSESVLYVPAARKSQVPIEAHAQIKAFTDSALLDQWLIRVISAASVEELFAPISAAQQP